VKHVVELVRSGGDQWRGIRSSRCKKTRSRITWSVNRWSDRSCHHRHHRRCC